MPRYKIFVTHDYVDIYEVEADDETAARASYERGEAEHVNHDPPQLRRVAVLREPEQVQA